MKKLLFVILIIFFLNLIWEFAHHTLYIDLSGIPKYTHLIIASFGDMFILVCIFGIISIKNRNMNWIQNPKKDDYFLLIFIGISIAILIEIINVNLGRWAYTSTMPTIFGIGISPLIQLALTGIITLKISKYGV